MKAGKYSVKELFVNRYVQQIIIPEIQRDYVWGEEQVIGLLNSIKKDFESFITVQVPKIETTDNDLEIAFESFYKKRNNGSNIGFIYAYNDDQYSGNYFLIDGQQRITTIFLMLLVLASKNERLNEKFKKTCLTDGLLKLDYKVRESAHHFLQQFTALALSSNTDFTNQNWYYSNKYDSDTTIKSLIQNFYSIQEYYENNLSNNLEAFYEYIEDYVEFWYFDTNISEQGEELYIYMNARGEQMQANENIKADLLSKLNTTEEKNKYGKLWEDWQDYFWVNRGENENADKGFNQFLVCVAGCENYLHGIKKYYSKVDFEKHGVFTKDIIDALDIKTIERYFKSLKFLYDNANSFKQRRNYCDWLDKALNVFWQLLNKGTVNWFADYNDNNRAVERSSMVFVWSVLHFFNASTNLQFLNIPYRLFRIYYVRYNNFVRSVSSIKIEVDSLVKSGIWKESIGTYDDGDVPDKIYLDEGFKNKLLSTCDRNLVNDIEELIWEIEDHKFNLEGRNVGNTNITHLIDDVQEATKEQLTLIRDKFYEIFPAKGNYHNIKHILLYYGQYFERVSPYYYENYCFNNWHRIIRGNPKKEKHQNVFKLFWDEFLNYKGTIEDFIDEKDTYVLEKSNCKNLVEQLLWYSRKNRSKMWSQGGYISFSHGSPISLPNWEDKDENFEDSYIYYNTKGNLKGGNPTPLSKI